MDNTTILEGQNPDQNLTSPEDDTQVAVSAAPTPELSLEKDAVIRRATEDYIASLNDPQALSEDEIKSGCMNAIIQAIAERNIVQAGAKIKDHLACLPDACISSLIQAQYSTKTISWTGGEEDAVVGIYMKDGTRAGIYDTSRLTLEKIIQKYKYTLTKNDINEVYDDLLRNSDFVTPSQDPDLVFLNNGILNYRTKELMPFTPDIVETRKSRINYITGNPPVNPHIVMPDGEVWDVESWMQSISDDPEIVDLHWKVLGALLRPNVSWDRIVCYYSQKGCNAKGTLCKLGQNLCGEGFYTSIPLAEFNRDPLLEKLLKVNAVIAHENDTDAYAKNVSKLKAVVTGDEISIDRKYLSALTFRFRGLIIQCVNELPNTADKTDSFYRRFLMIPFDKSFKGVERKYIKEDYLNRPEVLEYVLWRVMNMPDYYELPEPDACLKLMGQFKEYNDPVLQFVNDVFSRLTWDIVSQDFIYALYRGWCQKNNPSGKTASKNHVTERVRLLVKNEYPNEWKYEEKSHRINKNENLEPELMVSEYGLEDWRSGTYKGTDSKRIGMYDVQKHGRVSRYFEYIGPERRKDIEDDNED